MLTVLANRTYRHLLSAQVVALVGTGLATIALGLLAFDIAGGNAGAVLGTALASRCSLTSGLRRSVVRSPIGCHVAPSLWRWTSFVQRLPCGRVLQAQRR